MFIEKRLRKEDPWLLDDHHTADKLPYLSAVDATSRNYKLFAVLANVRCYANEALYPPRGMPDDADETLRRVSEGVDWHSHSWLTLNEFKACLHRVGLYPYKNTNSNAFYDWETISNYSDRPEDYTTVVNYCEEWILNENAEAMLLNRSDIQPEVRIIFWFDS